MRLTRFLSIFVASLLLAPPAVADLTSLAQEYRQAKGSVRGGPKDRAEQVEKSLVPILEKIGELDSDESFNFLVRELQETATAVPEVAAACAAPLAASSNPKALPILIQGTTRFPAVATAGILKALGKTERDLAEVERELLGAVQRLRDPELVELAAPVLGKLDTVAAAKVAISQIQGSRGRAGGGSDKQVDAVVAALGKTKSDAVKEWLARDAFAAAGSDPARLEAVLRLVGDLKIAGSRPALEKLSAHPDPSVATAATKALSEIGFDESADSLISALGKRRQRDDLRFRIEALDALARTGTDRALEVVLRFSRGKDPEMRAVAMGSLALFEGKPEAQAALVAGLQDSDATIRATSLRALSKVRKKFMISPLIDMVANEKEEEYLRIGALKLLVKATNQNMGLVGADWRKWWELAEPRFVFPDATEGGFTEVQVRDLSYFGIEVSSKRLGFLVDISSSMTQMVAVRTEAERAAEGGDSEGRTDVVKEPEPKREGRAGDARARKIDVLKRELVRVLQKLPPDTYINILTFHGTFDSWQKQLQPLAGSGRAKAVGYVQNLQTGHGTNVFDTLEFALKDRRVDTIYLLTDGMPTRGRITNPGEILDEIRVLNRLRGVTIHCIAFGEESQLLKDLAAANGGEYRFVDRY